MKNVGNTSDGRSQGVPKISGHPCIGRMGALRGHLCNSTAFLYTLAKAANLALPCHYLQLQSPQEQCATIPDNLDCMDLRFSRNDKHNEPTNKLHDHNIPPNGGITRKLCYRKDDRAMRPIGLHGCPENFRESLTAPTVTIPNIFHGLLFRSTL